MLLTGALDDDRRLMVIDVLDRAVGKLRRRARLSALEVGHATATGVNEGRAKLLEDPDPPSED